MCSKKKSASLAANTQTTPTKSDGPQRRLSLLNAAVTVLERSDKAMNVKAMIEAAKASGLWVPGNGKTPEQTLYSAILREIKQRGDAARFVKDTRGVFKFRG